MVVEVDDSGWGDLLGGVVVVARRVETGERWVGEVPLELFREGEFRFKEYLRAATLLVLEALDHLGVDTEEPIRICTGYVLSHARETLRALGYRVEEAKITGETQRLAEEAYLESLVRLGVGSREEVERMRSYQGFKAWVEEDPEARMRFVKTGWRGWGGG